VSAWPHSEDFLQQCFPALSKFSFVAQGGQKAVYSAEHNEAGQIALKVLPPNQTPERFDREIDAIRSIALKQVPQVVAFGALPPPFENHLWMMEQWIPGYTLRDRLIAGPLTSDLILKIATDMLEVLAVAESKRIVHRDIKPENILILPDESHSMLIDFGIARHLDRTSLTGVFMPCTIGYAPIEQLNVLKAEIDVRSDLFSLGVTLYECCEGINPFIENATSQQEVVDRINSNSLPRISTGNGKSEELADLIFCMTRTERVHRIRTAIEALVWVKEISKKV